MGKGLKPDFYFRDIYAIRPAFLQDHGVRGVILDIDNTLVYYGVFHPTQLSDSVSVFIFYPSYFGNGVIPAGFQELFNFSIDPVQQEAVFSFRISPATEYGSGNPCQKKNKNSPNPFHVTQTPFTLLYPQYPPVPLFSWVCILLRAPENRQKIRKELV